MPQSVRRPTGQRPARSRLSLPAASRHQARLGLILLIAPIVAAAAGLAGIAVAFAGQESPQPFGAFAVTIISVAAVAELAVLADWRARSRLAATVAANQAEIERRTDAERRLGETGEMLDAIVTASPVATQAIDLERRVLIWNPASERLFGWTADEVIGRPLPLEMTPREDRARSAARIRATIAGGLVNGDRVRRLTKDGDERWIDIYAAQFLDHDGQPMGVAGQLVDVTDRIRLETELGHAQKMGAVGLLAGEIAHDVNNMLTAVSVYADLIRTSAQGEIAADAAAIVDVVGRGRQLTRQLLDFARQSDEDARPIDIRKVILGVEPLIRRLMGGSIEVELELPRSPVIARVQVGQLEHALINLALNASDAMHGEGVLTVAVQHAGRDSLIEVRDTGVGVPESIVERIFEPFFTTKADGEGTGLGLAMVRAFVSNADGELSVRSMVDQGSTFSIRLPPADPAAD